MGEIKEKIKDGLREFLSGELLRRLKKYSDSGLSKADTQAKLVDPLFEKLGWNMSGEEVEREFAVLPEEKPADYIFKIETTPVMLMETDRVGSQLKDTREATLKRVIEYGKTTGISWCVFTNGDKIEVYNPDWPDRKLFFAISLSQLLDDFDAQWAPFFDSVWLLSKESLRSGESEKERNREYAKRVVLDILKEEGTIKFICEQALHQKVSEELTRAAIKELKVSELFPFPLRPPEVEIVPAQLPVQEPVEEELPSIELVPAPKKPLPQDVFQALSHQIHIPKIKEAFNTTVETIRRFGRDVDEETRKKSAIYRVKGREFVKLYPHKDYFEFSIFNPRTRKWLSFYIEEGNVGRWSERIDRARESYKEVRRLH